MAVQHDRADGHFAETVDCLGLARSYVDHLTVRHEVLVGRMSEILAAHLGFATEMARAIGCAARLHDIGKLAIAPAILHKPGSLTKEERQEIHRHSEYGAKILDISSDPYYRLASKIALHHHEHMDGSGYPYGLRGDQIPLEARVVALCDTYEALRSQRPYKAPMSHADTNKILLEGDDRVSPTFFDPRVLDAYCTIEGRLKKAYDDCLAEEAIASGTLSA